MNDTEIKQRYKDLLGFVPEGIENRLELAKKTNRHNAIESIENFRKELISNTGSSPKFQQLIHFAMLIAINEVGPAKLHAKGALKAGATIEELMTICETGAVIGGMPVFQRGINIGKRSFRLF